MKTFHICTIANKPGQYAAMRESFRAAGFDEERCTHEVFDNSRENRFEPYSTFHRILGGTKAKYFIFCHQDVLLSQGQGYAELVSALERLTQHDPQWGVAGNVGVNFRYQQVARITDPWPTPQWAGALPQEVGALDENFLVINGAAAVDWSTELSGFHFYGADVCLNAIRRGHRSYVIDFHLEHLSKGNLDASFWEMKQRFQRHWEKRFRVALIVSPTLVPIVLTKYSWLQKFCRLPAVEGRLMRPRVLLLAWLLSFRPGAWWNYTAGPVRV